MNVEVRSRETGQLLGLLLGFELNTSLRETIITWTDYPPVDLKPGAIVSSGMILRSSLVLRNQSGAWNHDHERHRIYCVDVWDAQADLLKRVPQFYPIPRPRGPCPEFPEAGSFWRHHRGQIYCVQGVANEVDTERFPAQVVYHDHDRKRWSRPLRDWHQSFIPWPKGWDPKG